MAAAAVSLGAGGEQQRQRRRAEPRREAGMGNLHDVLLWIAGKGRAGALRAPWFGILVNDPKGMDEAFP